MTSKFLNADLSMKVFGIYLCGLGLTLALIPNVVLPIVGFSPVDDSWIRIMGFSFFHISWIYYLAIKEQWISFYNLTALARLTIFGFMIILVIANNAPWQLIIFGIIDLAGALWTFISTKQTH